MCHFCCRGGGNYRKIEQAASYFHYDIGIAPADLIMRTGL